MNRPRRTSPAAEAKPNVPLDIAASDPEPSISEGSATDKGMDAVNQKFSDNPLISGNSGLNIRKGECPANPPPDTLTNQPFSPKDASPHASVVSTNANAPPLDSTSFHQFQLQLEPYVSHEINASSYPGYGGGGGTAPWNGYSQYINADGLHVVSPVVYNDNPSLVFHSGYGFNADIAYGQYSPVGTPLPPLMVEGQLYSAPPSQLPFSPSYFPPSNVPHMPSSTEFMTPENASIDSMFFGPGSAYFVNFGGGNQNLISSPLPSPTIYPPPMGILGSYENSFGQVSQQQRSSHGFGLMSSPQYPLGGSYQSSGFGGASFPYPVSNDLNHLALDKGRRRDRDQDSVSVSNDSRDIFNDRNRGPRASKMKGKSATEQGSLSSAAQKLLSSQKDFVIDYENAKFFIIKSFSEDNVHKSIKYSVWASTPHGNKKLDVSYHAAKEIKPKCPLFLFFSVNASGQFCGVAEMVGPVDFEKDAEYWQQDRWNGQFPVQWHIVKDVANIRFRHILLDNNDNKPVTHSRDSQEVGFKHGMEMLKIFKEHEARTCILDDFYFYDDREKALRDRKARQQTCESPRKAGADDEEEELLSRISQGLVLEDRKVVGESSESEAATEDNITATTLGG